MCGADPVLNAVNVTQHGSPPRVRGRLGTTTSHLPSLRFTPACAGQTSACRVAPSRVAVHPRVCGADVIRADRAAHFLRFTPACAGQTPDPLSPASVAADHPRVCGADPVLNAVNVTQHGSPPRVRGRPLHRGRNLCLMRFTPACAGQTGLQSYLQARASVHPRVCGADRHRRNSTKSPFGSPPRVRGRRSRRSARSAVPRFTPACAGQTAAAVIETPRMPVHPRVCGADFV